LRHAIRYGRDDRRRVEAAEEAHVREIDIEVAMAIDVSEVGATPVDGEDRAMGIEIVEPAHRDPVGH
jgi:hypothetical protein